MSKSWTSRLVWEARCWKIWLGRRWYWLWDSSSVSSNNCVFEKDDLIDLSSHRCAQLGYEFKMSDDSYRASITITCGADRSWNRDSLPPCECEMIDNPHFGIYFTINVAKKNTYSDFSTNLIKVVSHMLIFLPIFSVFLLTCSTFLPAQVVHCLTAPNPPAENKLTLRDYDPLRYDGVSWSYLLNVF